MKTEEEEIKNYLLLIELYCKQYHILLELMTPDQKAELKKKIKEVYTLMHDGFLL
jgi:hypothetical protein